jgi:hypothetical protein
MIGDMNDTKLFSPNSRPKTVIMKFTRHTDGSYHLEAAKYVKRVNQFESYTQRVDARDAAADFRTVVEYPLANGRFRDVADRHRDGGLQEETAVTFFDDDEG